jgi:hypothetical protein
MVSCAMLYSCIKNKECKAGAQPDLSGNYISEVSYVKNTYTYTMGSEGPVFTGYYSYDTTYVDTMNISYINSDEIAITHFLSYPSYKSTRNFKVKRWILEDEPGKHSVLKKQKAGTCREETRYNYVGDDSYLILRNDSVIYVSNDQQKTSKTSMSFKGKRK